MERTSPRMERKSGEVVLSAPWKRHLKALSPRDRGGAQGSTDWSTERTLADVEAGRPRRSRRRDWRTCSRPLLERGERNLPSVEAASEGVSARCICGSEELLLEAYLAVIGGRPQPEPVELESLTCPQCGREYEAIWLQDGRVARGEYRGQTELDE